MNGYDELLIKSIITILFCILSRFVIPYIRSKIDEEKWNKIAMYAELAVRTAEQLFKDNNVKREYVTEYIAQKAKEIGLQLSEQDVSNLVEYTVNLVKYGLQYTKNNE